MATDPVTRSALVNDAVARAQDLPQLVDQLKQVDPGLAQQFTGKALVASKTVWGVGATMIVTYVATTYGLGWDHDTVELVSGLAVIVATAVFRKLSSAPISGIFTKKSA